MDVQYIREEMLGKNMGKLIDYVLPFDDVIEDMRRRFDFVLERSIKRKLPYVAIQVEYQFKPHRIWLEWMTEEWDVFFVTTTDDNNPRDYRLQRISKGGFYPTIDHGGLWFIRKGLTAKEIQRLLVLTKPVTM